MELKQPLVIQRTQDDMFIQMFSDQESTSDYTPTSTNTAGTQRLAQGSKIMGAIRGRDAPFISGRIQLIFLMRFVGQPFTFSFEHVGTNCGLIGKNACMEVDGTAFWMSENGFFQLFRSASIDAMLSRRPCV